MAIRFSETVTKIKETDIAPILALTARPDVISFAGGFPAEESFPVKEFTQIAKEVMEKEGTVALQYGPTQGDKGLREEIAQRMNHLYEKEGLAPLSFEDILIVTGSQQALDMAGRLFLDKGDVVLVEEPTYMGAVSAFDIEGPKYVEVPTDEEGMISEELEKILQKEEKVKCIYVIPNYQNPTGHSWSVKRRHEFMDIVTRYEIPVIEDNPYGELCLEGKSLPPLMTMDPKNLVIYAGSFSKILSPGMRLAWVITKGEIRNKMTLVKSATDLHTSGVIQKEVAAYLKKYDLDEHIQKICHLYRHRRDYMMEMMKKYFPEGLTWTHPEGGLFLWITLPPSWDTRALLSMAIQKKVAFAAGDSFFPTSGKKNFLRLNFSYNRDELIEEGIRRLGEAMKEYEKRK